MLSVVSPCCLASCSSCNTLLVHPCYPTRVDPQKTHPNRFLEVGGGVLGGIPSLKFLIAWFAGPPYAGRMFIPDSTQPGYG